MEDTTYNVYLGLDVGKTDHHGCALTADGTKVYDKACPRTKPTSLRCSPNSRPMAVYC